MTAINGVEQAKEFNKLNIAANGLLIDASDILAGVNRYMTIEEKRQFIRWLKAVSNWQKEMLKGDRC